MSLLDALLHRQARRSTLTHDGPLRWPLERSTMNEIDETPGRAMIDVAVIERDHRATIAKLRQIAADADKRSDEGDGYASQYWRGYREGLLRSIQTIEGRDHSPS